MKNTNHPAPHFSLDGERSGFDDPAFVHLEDIASRSQEREWVIAPHRHTRLYQILLLESGDTEVTLDSDKHFLSGHWAILVPAGIVHSFHFAPNTVGKVLSIAEALLINNRAALPAAITSTLLSRPVCLDFSTNEDCFARSKTLLGLLQAEFSHPQMGQNTMVENLLGALLVQLQRLQHTAPSHTNEDRLTPKLKQLIHQHFREHWPVTRYADLLNVSEKKLTRTTQQTLGRTVKELCLERLHLEAKRQLIYTQKSVEDIAHELGYTDLGYFCRVFKRTEGQTPVQFRRLSAGL